MTTLQIEIEDLRPVSARTTDSDLVVHLADGRTIATPLAWYPRLAAATDEERNRIELMPMGIHWPDLDEDLSIAGMLAGHRG